MPGWTDARALPVFLSTCRAPSSGGSRVDRLGVSTAMGVAGAEQGPEDFAKELEIPADTIQVGATQARSSHLKLSGICWKARRTDILGK